MRVAIVDDEERILNQLEGYIESYGQEKGETMQVFTFSTAKDMLDFYDRSYDIIFLDIEMADMDGLEAARRVRLLDKDVVLIFVTNMAQYAINGYEVNALDFILKPVTYENFVFRMEKALRYAAKNSAPMLTLKAQEGTVRVVVDEIYYVEVMLHYLIYHTAIGTFKVRGTFKEVTAQLGRFSFAKSKNCYLVNLRYVEAISGSVLQVKGEKLQISRNCKNEFMQAFTRYVGGIQS